MNRRDEARYSLSALSPAKLGRPLLAGGRQSHTNSTFSTA
jgi:hypothetical protein